MTTCELYIDKHLLGLIVAVAEGHRTVGITSGGGIGGELPPIKMYVTAYLTEAEVEVVDACCSLDLGMESLIAVETVCVGNADITDDRPLTTVEAQGDGTLTLGSSSNAETLGTQSEIYAA